MEATWEEGSGGENDGGGEGDRGEMAEPAVAPKPGVAAAGCTDEYIQMFVMKFVCPQEECFGTMAPTFGTNKAQCNMCGHVRSEAEFLAEVESYGG